MVSGSVAGRPEPLPGPFVPNCLSALATSDGGGGAFPVVFLGLWDQGGEGNHLNRSVTVSLKRPTSMAQPKTALQYRIDDKSANPLGLYHVMGSPASPSVEQRQQLMAASKVVPVALPVSSEGTVTVLMTPNSAVMVTFA